MVRMTINDNASVTVDGFMARAFLAMNHLQVDSHAINSIGNSCINYAEEHKWLKPENAETAEDLAFFVVGVETILKNGNRGMRQRPLPTSTHLLGNVSLSFVGRSSIGLHVEILSYQEDAKDERKPVGSFNITCVAMSKKQRKPTAIPAEHLTLLEGSIAQKKAAMSEEEFQRHILTRLNVKEIVEAAEMCNQASVDGNTPRALLKKLSIPVSDMLSSYRRRHHLRESDIDYNLHFNQQRMIQLVSDAFRGATGDARCLLSRVVPEGQSYIMADLLIRQFRIDYVKEVPMNMEGVEIQVFVASPEDEEVIRSQSEKHTFENVVKVLFVCRGVPSMDSAEGVYPAAVGHFLITV